jgi:hypothetical protein
MNEGKEAIDKIREKINVLLNVFSWTNDYTEGRKQVLYELLDYLDELERDM